MNDTRNKVLIVDDNPDYLRLMEMALEGDYNIVTAPDGTEGMERARKDKPDLILLDVMMPGVSGLDMLHMLLADNETCRIPVIFVTASQFDESTEMAFKVEMNVKGFLKKPCAAEALRKEIRNNLPKKAAN